MVPLIPDAVRSSLLKILGRDGFSATDIFGPSLQQFANKEWLHSVGIIGRIKADPRQNELDGVSSMMTARIFENGTIEGAEYGIAVRHPMADIRWMEYCLNVPTHIKMPDAHRRQLVRNYLDGKVVPQLAWRIDKGPIAMEYPRQLKESRHQFVQMWRDGSATKDYIDQQYMEQLVAEIETAPLRELQLLKYSRTMMAGLIAGHFLSHTAPEREE